MLAPTSTSISSSVWTLKNLVIFSWILFKALESGCSLTWLNQVLGLAVMLVVE